MTDKHLEPDDQTGAAAHNAAAQGGGGTQAAVSTKLLSIIGAILLVIGAVTWIISLSSVKGFTEDNPTEVEADRSYYILANKDALDATACGFFGPGETPIHNKVKEIEDLTGEDNKIKDISLPFSKQKGVYARVQFTEDIEGAHIRCNEGNNYLSTKSGGALNALRWVSMIGVGAGIALLISAAILRGREGRAASEDQAQGAGEPEDI